MAAPEEVGGPNTERNWRGIAGDKVGEQIGVITESAPVTRVHGGCPKQGIIHMEAVRRVRVDDDRALQRQVDVFHPEVGKRKAREGFFGQAVDIDDRKTDLSAVLELEHVGPGTAPQYPRAMRFGFVEYEVVCAATEERVYAEVANYRVISCAAVQKVIPVASICNILSRRSRHIVVPTSALVNDTVPHKLMQL